MKKLLLVAVFAAFAGAVEAQTVTLPNGCDCVPLDTVYRGTATKVKTRKLSADTCYLLNGLTRFQFNSNLIIPAGTVIYGSKANKGTLVIERGGKISATGTKSAPIVFTSDQTPGSRTAGDWGGVVLCGKARIHNANAVSGVYGIDTMAIEGTFGTAPIYAGGNDDDDNSGTLVYAQIHYAGINVGATGSGNELNSLTFYGVGRKTRVQYVQTTNGNDDAFEFFGGTVNPSYLVSLNTIDDDLDVDAGFTGHISNALVLRLDSAAYDHASNGTSSLIESDNDAGSSNSLPITRPIFSNITAFGPMTNYTAAQLANTKFTNGLHIRRNSATSVYNSIFSGYLTGVMIDGNTTIGRANNLNDTHNVHVEYNVFNNVNTLLNTTAADWSDKPSTALNIVNDVNAWFYQAQNGNVLIAGDYAKLGFEEVLDDDFCAGVPVINLKTTFKAPAFPSYHVAIIKTGSGFGLNADLDSAAANKYITRKNNRGTYGTWVDGWTEWCPNAADYCSISTPGQPKNNGKASTQTIDKEVGLNLYPNPTSSEINVDFELTKASNVTVTLISMEGKQISKNAIENSQLKAGAHSIKLNVSDVPAGVYVVKVHNGSEEISSLVVVE